MKSQRFGQYLVDKGVISNEAHEKALAIQSKNRLLGEIAIEMNYLDEKKIRQVTEMVNKSKNNLKFGEAAVSLGLINSNQLRFMLEIRPVEKWRYWLRTALSITKRCFRS